MKKTKRLWALLLAMVMALGLISTAFAAPTIDSGRKASLSLYKYDITAASADGAWDAASYVSTGVQDDAVTDKLAQYAIQGVEFTYLRVADIAMNNELVNGQRQVCTHRHRLRGRCGGLSDHQHTAHHYLQGYQPHDLYFCGHAE